MTFLSVAVLSIAWMNFDSPDNGFWPGEVTYMCDAALRDLGPKDSTLISWCEYERWMDDWIGSGSGPDMEFEAEFY
jgi:hypothetical protein